MWLNEAHLAVTARDYIAIADKKNNLKLFLILLNII